MGCDKKHPISGAMSMSRVRVFVGLDYHDDEVQVCILNEEGEILKNRSVSNNVCILLDSMSKYDVAKVAIEACCGAADLAEELIRTGRLDVSLAHPGYVARMKGNPDKTDYSDARLLADLARVGFIPAVWLAPEELRDLRQLVRFRQQLVDERRDCKLRVRAILREHRIKSPDQVGRPWTKPWLAWLHSAEMPPHSKWILEQHLQRISEFNKQIKVVECRLEQHAETDGVVQQLLELKSVGLVTAMMIRAEIGRFDRFKNGRQLARYCGLSPRNASSGKRQADAGMIRAGNPQLRATLIQLGQRLIRQDERWMQLAIRLRNSGKKHNVIVAAVANRWTRWLYHQIPLAA
jgi:transposase